MSDEHNGDRLLEALATLPTLAPDPVVAETLRLRSRAALEREPQTLTGRLEPATVGSVCAMYAWEIVRVVVR